MAAAEHSSSPQRQAPPAPAAPEGQPAELPSGPDVLPHAVPSINSSGDECGPGCCRPRLNSLDIAIAAVDSEKRAKSKELPPLGHASEGTEADEDEDEEPPKPLPARQHIITRHKTGSLALAQESPKRQTVSPVEATRQILGRQSNPALVGRVSSGEGGGARRFTAVINEVRSNSGSVAIVRPPPTSEWAPRTPRTSLTGKEKDPAFRARFAELEADFERMHAENGKLRAEIRQLRLCIAGREQADAQEGTQGGEGQLGETYNIQVQAPEELRRSWRGRLSSAADGEGESCSPNSASGGGGAEETALAARREELARLLGAGADARKGGGGSLLGAGGSLLRPFGGASQPQRGSCVLPPPSDPAGPRSDDAADPLEESGFVFREASNGGRAMSPTSAVTSVPSARASIREGLGSLIRQISSRGRVSSLAEGLAGVVPETTGEGATARQPSSRSEERGEGVMTFFQSITESRVEESECSTLRSEPAAAIQANSNSNEKQRATLSALSQLAQPRTVSLFPEYFNPPKSPARDLAQENSEEPAEAMKSLRMMESVHCSLSGLVVEEVVEAPLSPFVLSAASKLRLTWDLLALPCLLAELWLLSLQLAFLPQPPPDLLPVFQLLNAFFCVDLLLNLHTAPTRSRLGSCGTYCHYLRTWFLPDLLACLPWGLLLSGARWPRLLRLLRLPRLLASLRRLRPQLESALLPRRYRGREAERQGCLLRACGRLLLLLAALAACAHVQVCVFELLGGGEKGHWRLGLQNYKDAIGFSYTALTVGTVHEEAPWALEALLHSGRLVALALLAAWTVQDAMSRQEHEAKQQMLQDAMRYLKDHEVSPRTRLQVMAMGEARCSKEVQQHFEDFIATFPEEVQRRVSEEMWSKPLLSLQLLRHVGGWHPNFIKELAATVREEILAARTVVCYEGDASIAAYMVLRGELHVHSQLLATSKHVANFTPGMWVGEKALVNPGLRRSATVTAEVISTLMAVPADGFQELLSRFELRTKFEELCEDQLWKGLCGRCGTLGHHFTDACPLGNCCDLHRCNSAANGTQLMNRMSSLRSKRGKSTRTAPAAQLERTLTEFLKVHSLHRVAPQLQRMNITNLGDLELMDLGKLRAQVEDLTDQEEAVFSHEAIEDFQERLKSAGRSVMWKGRLHRTQHLLFLSHYKVEAGTEAALMRSELEQLMHEDPCSLGRHFDVPVFLDSEDLTDLHILQERVFSSHNIVVLLTKDVFTRPWCLVEIVSAIRWSIPVLLVTVEKPGGNKFEFPNEAFWEGLSKRLSKQDQAVLTECGIGMEEVVRTLKEVMKRIAVPYSPHKSGVIRRAELQALLEEASLREEHQEGGISGAISGASMPSHG